ncbi:MAG: alkaline phosphatase family protein [Chloroflexi bacterium]|nr:alkaline phosphatase family protein [Chloroflexota bacterium]
MLKKIATLTIVPLLIMLWARFGAQPLALLGFNALVNYPSPYTDPIPPGKEGDAVSKQVVLVMVDALRADTARTLPTVKALMDKGADCVAQVGQPSFSLPGWTVIGTGAWQEQSGVTLNFYKDAIKVDTIFQAAKRKNLTTALVAGGGSWKQLYPRGVDFNESFKGPDNPYVDLPGVRSVDDQVEQTVLKILKENKPNFVLYYVAEPDDAGHASGGSSSPYKDAALATDARVARLLSAINLSDSTVILTSDHGMRDGKGHGGNEPEVLATPLVMAGKGIKAGSKCAAATQADIAPTIAVLLGTSIPAHNQGKPLFEILDLPATLRAKRAVDAAQEIADRYVPVAKYLNAPAFDHKKLDEAKSAAAKGDADGAVQAALADFQNTNTQFASAREAKLNQERLPRLPIAILILIPFAAYFYIYRKMGWAWFAPVVGLVVYNVVYNALYFGRGFTYSLSVFNVESNIEPFFQARTIDAMIALLIAFIGVGAASRRADVYNTALNAVNTAFLIFAALVVQILIFFVLWNSTFAWYIPDLALGFKYYLDVLQTSAFWPLLYVPLLAILPFIALGVRWVAVRVMK